MSENSFWSAVILIPNLKIIISRGEIDSGEGWQGVAKGSQGEGGGSRQGGGGGGGGSGPEGNQGREERQLVLESGYKKFGWKGKAEKNLEVWFSTFLPYFFWLDQV